MPPWDLRILELATFVWLVCGAHLGYEEMAAGAQRKTGNMLGLVLTAPKISTSDIGHVVVISGVYWQGCDADD